VLDLIEAGRPVAEVAKALGISDRTIYTWRRQDRIDKGLEPGLTLAEKSELQAARQRDISADPVGRLLARVKRGSWPPARAVAGAVAGRAVVV